MSTEQIADLKTLDAELAKDSMKGLWVREETLRREPTPFGKPMLWKWANIRQGLEAAGRLITTNYKGIPPRHQLGSSKSQRELDPHVEHGGPAR